MSINEIAYALFGIKQLFNLCYHEIYKIMFICYIIMAYCLTTYW